VWVFSNAAAFQGANFTWTGQKQRPNATRCMAPPRYDPYTQQLTWRLEWWARGNLLE
jgi:hypothetical protein